MTSGHTLAGQVRLPTGKFVSANGSKSIAMTDDIFDADDYRRMRDVATGAIARGILQLLDATDRIIIEELAEMDGAYAIYSKCVDLCHDLDSWEVGTEDEFVLEGSARLAGMT